MAALHSLLALYGALDDAVVAANDPDSPVTQAVEAFLPGTTRPGRRGWFDDIRNLVSRLSVDPAQTDFPNVTDALRELAELRVTPTGAQDRADQVISPAELARFLYAMVPHCRLLLVGDVDLYARALAIAVPADSAADRIDGGRVLYGLFADLTQHANFAGVIVKAAKNDPPLVSTEVARVVTNTDFTAEIRRDNCGDEFAALTVDYFSDTVDVPKVKGVVDPLNWKRCCQFFCDMKPLNPKLDSYGWNRVLEMISTLCGGYQLKTAIKYWKAETPDGGFVNYDLDDARQSTPDSGVTLIDRGFIRFEKEVGGVRIRTRKEVKFAGVSALATLIYALVGGYAAIGQSMLVGCAQNQPAGAVVWCKSEPTGKPVKPYVPKKCDTPAPTPCGCGNSDSVAPAFAEAAHMWAACITEMSTEYAELVDRCSKRDVDTTELIDFGTRVSVRMATDPWKILGLFVGNSSKHTNPGNQGTQHFEEDR